ncbi:MAG: hypothetical protein H6Q60_1501 [Oscillospiraceae bacterium]|nr:hypothetical protein [Oscillospiraceae bacterium]
MPCKRILTFVAVSLFLFLTACGSSGRESETGGTSAVEEAVSESTDLAAVSGVAGDAESTESVSEQETAQSAASETGDAVASEYTAASSTSKTAEAASSAAASADTATTDPTAPTTPDAPTTPTISAETEVAVEDSTTPLLDVWADMRNEMGELPALESKTAADVESWYGIDSSCLEEFVLEMPSLSVNATEFFMAKVKDGSMDTVKAACQKRQETLADQFSMYLPKQGELVSDYKLVTNGDYILFCVSEYADKAVSVFNSEIN